MSAVWLWLLIVMNLFWAGTVSMYKYLGAYLDAGAIASVRFGLAAVCLGVLWPWLPGKGPRGKDLLRALTMGVIVFCLSPRLQIEGVQRGQAGDTSLLIGLEPLIVALGAAVVLKERITARRWWGFGLGMLGIALISRVWRDDVQALHGLLANLIFVSSFLCEAAFSLIGKPMLDRVSPLKLVACGLLGGTIANVAISGVNVPAMPMQAWLALAYLAIICTAVGYALWYFAIQRAPVNLVGLTVYTQPVAGLLLATVWLGSPLHWGQFWGSAVIIAGLLIGLRAEPPERTAPAVLAKIVGVD
jgi:drug/metabolite transporter (DMT)-like permease